VTQTAYVGVDLGAGSGAKIGLFDERCGLLDQTELPTSHYGASAETLADALAACIGQFLQSKGGRSDAIRSVGIASPGLFRSDGSYSIAANLTFLNGQNLPGLLRERVHVPVAIENDANAGGLAEWSILRTELLYWVFGGGWGGSWISADGDVRFPTLDWDNDDGSLHLSNEPGFAIPLDRLTLKNEFLKMGVSYERFEQLLVEELDPPEGVITGPSGSPDHIRAEVLLSGPGRCRLFRAAVGDDDFYTRFLHISEAEQITDPSVAGKFISKLSALRVEAAVVTDRLFGRILAEATRILLKQARADGCPEGIPICLGGKPSYALPYFGPSTQRSLGAMGIMSYMRPSIIDERGSNANLVGACVVAHKAHDGNRP